MQGYFRNIPVGIEKKIEYSNGHQQIYAVLFLIIFVTSLLALLKAKGKVIGLKRHSPQKYINHSTYITLNSGIKSIPWLFIAGHVSFLSKINYISFFSKSFRSDWQISIFFFKLKGSWLIKICRNYQIQQKRKGLAPTNLTSGVMLYWSLGYSLERAPKVLTALRAMTAHIWLRCLTLDQQVVFSVARITGVANLPPKDVV